MTRLRLTLAATLSLFLAAPRGVLLAQGGAAASLQACGSSMDERMYEAYQQANKAGKPMDEATIASTRAGIARECLGKVRLADLDLDALPVATMLFRYARDTVRADSASQRMLAIVPGDRRPTALFALSMIWQGTPRGDRWMATLDSTRAAVAQLRFQAHAQNLEHYRHEDVDEQVMQHAKAMIALAPEVGGTTEEFNAAMVSAYKGLAEVHGDYGQVDSALAVLDRGIAKYGPVTKDTAESLRTLRTRYAMVGQAAPPIEAKLWLNAPAGTHTLPFTGKVTVLQFTATWCPPCRRSYPAMLALHERFGTQPFQVVFETTLYGVFEGRKMGAAEEVASQRRYYLEKHGMRFPIAIYDTVSRAEGAPYANANDDRYHLTDIPQVVVLDRQGRIRRIFVGWDAGHEKRIAELVAQLLAEKA